MVSKKNCSHYDAKQQFLPSAKHMHHKVLCQYTSANKKYTFWLIYIHQSNRHKLNGQCVHSKCQYLCEYLWSHRDEFLQYLVSCLETTSQTRAEKNLSSCNIYYAITLWPFQFAHHQCWTKRKEKVFKFWMNWMDHFLVSIFYYFQILQSIECTWAIFFLLKHITI